jgi:hypothetical protein
VLINALRFGSSATSPDQFLWLPNESSYKNSFIAVDLTPAQRIIAPVTADASLAAA